MVLKLTATQLPSMLSIGSNEIRGNFGRQQIRIVIAGERATAMAEILAGVGQLERDCSVGQFGGPCSKTPSYVPETRPQT
jgi:hypothetical protein